jgi:RimJ/RimL family protein N-acetyltransferase
MPLRPAVDADACVILAWRNQPVNRQMSVHQHVIGPDEHQAWWARTVGDPSRRVLVFEYEGRRLGVVNFFDLDLDARSGSWGFYLDHQTVTAEGLAFTAWMQVMNDATDYAFDELGLDALEGEVLAVNKAVRHMNRRFRFVEGKPERREVNGHVVTVHPIRLRRQDRLGGRRASE